MVLIFFRLTDCGDGLIIFVWTGVKVNVQRHAGVKMVQSESYYL